MASKFVWYELMTSNAFAAESFYRDVVGWSTRDAGMPDFKYILLSVGDSLVAGLVQFPADAAQAQAQPAWFGYIGVDDVDAKADEAVKLGAKLHHAPTDIPNNIGRFAVLSDPQGAFFSLFKPNGTPPAPLPPMTPGTIGWHELHTKNAQKAFDFYSTLFGWQRLARWIWDRSAPITSSATKVRQWASAVCSTIPKRRTHIGFIILRPPTSTPQWSESRLRMERSFASRRRSRAARGSSMAATRRARSSHSSGCVKPTRRPRASDRKV